MTDIIFTANPQNYSITNISDEAPRAALPAWFSLSDAQDLEVQLSQPCPVESSKSLPLDKSEPEISAGKQDVYTRVTNKIIADLEKGDLTWRKPWDCGHGWVSRPLRADGTPYQGINVLALWGRAAEMGYRSPVWMTYNRAKELGGQVKKGEKGSLVVYAKSIVKSKIDEDGEETTATIPFLKGYTVFNAEQIEGLAEKFYTVPSIVEESRNRLEAVERFISGTKATIQHGGNQAFYSPTHDAIQMPLSQSFRDMESYYAILAHEMTHWTSHSSRLDRKFEKQQSGNAAYAMEELVAEIGSAFLCADLGITPETREDHAAYIQSWLEVLKKDRRAIFRAASHAQRAVDFLHGLSASIWS